MGDATLHSQTGALRIEAELTLARDQGTTMALRLQITSRHRQALGERGTKEFGRDGGTIGRSLESDWVLPDGQRYISSRHASIDFRSGSYYIVDTSTNGVYVNDAEQPVGRGNPQRLFTGDRIRLGEYEIGVEIDEEESTTEQLSDNDHVDPVARAQRVPPPDPTRADLIQPDEITAVGIEVLLKEDAEFGELQRAAKLAASSLRLEEDPAERPSEPPARTAAPKANAPTPSVERAQPPPVSAAARVAPTAPAKQPPAASARRSSRQPPRRRSPRPTAPRRRVPPYRPRLSTRSFAARGCRPTSSTTSRPSRRSTASGSCCAS